MKDLDSWPFMVQHSGVCSWALGGLACTALGTKIEVSGNWFITTESVSFTLTQGKPAESSSSEVWQTTITGYQFGFV